MITSLYSSFWGGAASYHKADLTALMQAVDYLSIHTYPFHDSHYNADFAGRNGMDAFLPKTHAWTELEHAAVQFAG